MEARRAGSRRRVVLLLSLVLAALGSLALAIVLAARRDGGDGPLPDVGPQDRAAQARPQLRDDAPAAARVAEAPHGTPEEPRPGEATSGSLVRVLDEEGVPVSGAKIATLAAPVRLLVTCDARGEARLPRVADGADGDGADGADAILVAAARGFVAAEFRAEIAETGEAVVVVLRRGEALEGIVVEPTGAPAGAGVRVLALDGRRLLAPARIELALRGTPSVPMALTDAGGRFRLEGLDPRCATVLLAAGKGLVAFDPFRPAVRDPLDGTVEVRAGYLYGALVRARDTEARPLPLDPRIGGRWWPRGYGAPGLEPPLEQVPLIGERIHDLSGLRAPGEPLGPLDALFLFSSEVDALSLPFGYEVHPPGYLPVQRELAALRVVDAVSEVSVELVRVAEGFGELAVELQGGEGSEWAARHPRRATVELTSRAGDLTLELDLLAGSDAVPGIPYGDYEARFRAGHSFFTFPPPAEPGLPVRIGPTPARLVVDARGRGSLVLRVAAPSGASFVGPLAGELVLLGRDDEIVDFHFPRPPYRFCLLAPGSYEVRLGQGARPERAVVGIEPGAEASLELVAEP